VLAASQYQLDTIKTARHLGYRVITTDNVPTNPGHVLADRSYGIDTTDAEAVLGLARREKIDGVISPGTDVAICTAAHVADRMGLAGPPLEAAAIVSSKLRFREFATQRGLPAPEAWPASHDAPADERHFSRGPLIVKPDRSSGSKGIFIVRSAEELRQRLPETLSFSQNGCAILERYIDGFQGTCEGVLQDGRVALAVVLDRQTAKPPYVATWGHHLPSLLPTAVQEKLLARIKEVWAMLRVRDGAFDCDFVASDGEVFILEMSPRLGGNSISRLLATGCDFNIVEYCVRHACGEAVVLPPHIEAKPSAVVLLGVEQEGRLTYDRGEADALCRESWVQALTFDVEPGATVHPFINGRHRVGEAIVSGGDRSEVDAHVSELRQRLKLKAA